MVMKILIKSPPRRRGARVRINGWPDEKTGGRFLKNLYHRLHACVHTAVHFAINQNV